MIFFVLNHILFKRSIYTNCFSTGFGATSNQLPGSSMLANTSMFGANTTIFGNTTQSTQLSSTAETSGFQLQNPPPGNKRGKR